MPEITTKHVLTAKRCVHLALILLLSVVLVACSGSPRKVPVADRSHGRVVKPSKPVTKGQYRVRKGDTLYSIAFRFGWDWRTLARHNGIRAPYTIRPGQLINFAKPVKTAQKKTRAAQPKARTKPASKPQSQTKKTATKSKPKPKPKPPVAAKSSVKGWRWPATGKVVAKFSSKTSINKGIDIAGKLGQPVVAAAKGTVVYAGSGLRGYGEMVIIKHDDVYISAYGHNRRLLVNEGQQVKAGQQIAEMGSTGTDRVKLHFEVRRQGKPVDPLRYLPAR